MKVVNLDEALRGIYIDFEMGFDTGLDLDLLIQSTAWLECELQHSTPGLVAKAGGFPTP